MTRGFAKVSKEMHERDARAISNKMPPTFEGNRNLGVIDDGVHLEGGLHITFLQKELDPYIL